MKLPFRDIGLSTAAQKTNKKDLSQVESWPYWLAKRSTSQPGAPALQVHLVEERWAVCSVEEKENPDFHCFQIWKRTISLYEHHQTDVLSFYNFKIWLKKQPQWPFVT